MTARKKSPQRDRSKARSRRGLHITVTAVLAVLILVNMTVIFHFSSASREESGELSEGLTRKVVRLLYRDFEDRPVGEQWIIMQRAHKFVRKAAHFSEFALLGFLSACLLLYISAVFRRLRLWLTLTVPAVLALLYAISDEIHQIFSGRGPRVTDVLIDFSGAVCGILLVHGAAYLIARGKRGSKPKPKKKSRRRSKPCEAPATD